MPIARGTMQMGRINVFPTTTTLVSINPSSVGFCGDPIIFTVQVANNRGAGFPIPTGTVLIKDRTTNTTIASGPLVPGVSFSTVVINTTVPISNNQIYAQYLGVVNLFGASESTPDVPYSVSLISTVVTITNTPNTNFCFHNNFNLNVNVDGLGTATVPTGSVQVNLYSDPISFVTIGTATLNGSGNATVVLPADSTVPGNTYYIQAKYLGAGCFGISNSPIGTSGTPIHSYSLTQNTTTTTAGVAGSTTFCINSSKTFNATVSSAFLGGPNNGSVTWTAVKSPTTIILGTDSSISNGIASIVVPGGTFPSTGTWTITAAYTGDSFCFANSNSVGLSVFPSTFGIDFLKEAGPASFCRATAQVYSYVISSSAFIGTINGTFVLKSSFGTTLKTVTTSGSSAGFVVQFSLAANTVLSGVQDFFVQFTPISGSCYSSDTSSNFEVTVSANPPQVPSSTVLAVTNSTTGDSTPPIVGDDNDSYVFNITINKVGKIGPLDGAGSLNGSATLELFNAATFTWVTITNSIDITDHGSFGFGSYTIPNGISSSVTSARAKWNGNACYGQQFSNFIEMDISHTIS
jgi:hypothetical protein